MCCLENVQHILALEVQICDTQPFFLEPVWETDYLWYKRWKIPFSSWQCDKIEHFVMSRERHAFSGILRKRMYAWVMDSNQEFIPEWYFDWVILPNVNCYTGFSIYSYKLSFNRYIGLIWHIFDLLFLNYMV